MKSYFIVSLSLLLFCIPINAQEGWFWQNPIPQGNHIFDLAILDENTILSVTEGGFLIKSTDRGLSWNTLEVGVKEDLNSIFFIDSELGWISADDGLILKSTDGGTYWNKYYMGFNADILDVYFLDELIGWASGSSGYILKTTDGGMNWTNSSISFYRINKIYFVNQEIGWAVGNFHVFKSTDGGNSWIEDSVSSSSHNYSSISFISADTGWIGTDYGNIYRTTDSGTTWTSYAVGSFIPVNDIYFSAFTNGWAVGKFISHSSDGGETWDTLQGGTNSYSAIEIDDGYGLCVGNNGLMSASTDYGVSWNRISNAIATCLFSNSVYFIDQFNGWACGANCYENKLLKTTDGGITWTGINSSNFANLFDVFFFDNNSGFVIGEAGQINITTDGGNTWISQYQGDVNYSIDFVDALNGWIASRSHILRTTNGGVSWITTSLPGLEIYSVSFVNQSIGWAAGGNKILRTTNGGANWIEYTITAILRDIQFINENIGWAVGENGIIVKSIDGGINWYFLDSDTTELLKSVSFIDSNYGWVVGFSGLILNTTDGGLTWEKQRSETRKLLNSVYFIDSLTGWVVGENGTILKTTNAGVTFIEEESESTYPNSFLLSQNYPNPFNPSTRIQYSVNSTQKVTLKVYDLLGREVATLVNEEKPAGEYEVEFEGVGLPTGIYFYQLRAGSLVETKKMVLLK